MDSSSAVVAVGNHDTAPVSGEPTVLAAFAQLYLAFGLKYGIVPERACALAGIALADVVDRDRHIPRSWALALQHNLIRSLPELAVGLELGRFASIEALGYMGYALKSCATPLAALQLLARSVRLVDTSYRSAHTRVELGEHTAFRTRRIPLDSPESIEMGFVNIVHLMRQSMGEVHPSLVQFAHPERALRAALEAFFQCPVEFDRGEHALLFESEVLLRPNPHADGDALGHFSAQLERQLCALEDLVSALRRIIETQLGRREMSLAGLAKHMHVSPRALQRALKRHGVTYSELLSQARHSLSLRLLANPRLAIYEVALGVGYEDLRAFSRAFRAWTGSSPSDYRATNGT